jgi:hypothetical protein
MKIPKLLLACLLMSALIFFNQILIAQVQINGTVYDRSQRYPMPGVSVIGTSGGGTITDSLGNYSIKLRAGDSIYFSYLNKPTDKYPVKDIPADQPFDISLEVAVEALQTVVVNPKIYRQDSLENRIEYEKIFDFGKDYLTSMKSNRGRGMGVGIDFDMLFDGKKNRRIMAFQKRLEQEEKDKYVDHRFTKALVKRITGLEPPALDTFMVQYRPSYDFIQSCETDYEYYKFIADWGKDFKVIWKQEHTAIKKD